MMWIGSGLSGPLFYVGTHHLNGKNDGVLRYREFSRNRERPKKRLFLARCGALDQAATYSCRGAMSFPCNKNIIS